MYHQLGTAQRLQLIAHMNRMRDQLLRPFTSPEDIPPGPGHVYNSLTEAIGYLEAPEVSESYSIITTHGSYPLRHDAGCFTVQYFTGLVWHVTEHPTGRLWRVKPQDGTGEGYWLDQRGQETPLATGNNWKDVLDTIQANYDFP